MARVGGDIYKIAALLRPPHFRADRRRRRLFSFRSQQVAERAYDRGKKELRIANEETSEMQSAAMKLN